MAVSILSPVKTQTFIPAAFNFAMVSPYFVFQALK